jgi:CheY-like chemotaxis protein
MAPRLIREHSLRRRLLLVGDNPVNQKLAQRLLEKMGIKSPSPITAGKRSTCCTRIRLIWN